MNKLILARNTDTLVRCGICGQPSPPEHVALGKLCLQCWSRAAQERGWMAEPQIVVQVGPGQVAAIPQRAVYPLMLQGMGNERDEADANPIRVLARVLDERERLRAFQEERAVEEKCAYCGEAGEEGGLMAVLSVTGLPDIFHCRDLGACDGRLMRGLVALAQRVQSGERTA